MLPGALPGDGGIVDPLVGQPVVRVLPAIGDARHALTVDNAAAPGAGLRIGLAWWVPGMLLAVAYCAYTCRRFRGKMTLEGEGY